MMGLSRLFVLGQVTAVRDHQYCYPSCQQCYSKVYQDDGSYSCLKCGSTFSKSSLCRRYRLHIVVCDRNTECNVTVFGSVLEGLFGCTANHLTRYVEYLHESLPEVDMDSVVKESLQTALVGHYFLFGFKTTPIERNLPEDGLLHPVSLDTVMSNSGPALMPSQIGVSYLGGSTQKEPGLVATQMLQHDGKPLDKYTLCPGTSCTILDSLCYNVTGRKPAQEECIMSSQNTSRNNSLDQSSTLLGNHITHNSSSSSFLHTVRLSFGQPEALMSFECSRLSDTSLNQQSSFLRLHHESMIMKRSHTTAVEDLGMNTSDCNHRRSMEFSIELARAEDIESPPASPVNLSLPCIDVDANDSRFHSKIVTNDSVLTSSEMVRQARNPHVISSGGARVAGAVCDALSNDIDIQPEDIIAMISLNGMDLEQSWNPSQQDHHIAHFSEGKCLHTMQSHRQISSQQTDYSAETTSRQIKTGPNEHNEEKDLDETMDPNVVETDEADILEPYSLNHDRCVDVNSANFTMDGPQLKNSSDAVTADKRDLDPDETIDPGSSHSNFSPHPTDNCHQDPNETVDPTANDCDDFNETVDSNADDCDDFNETVDPNADGCDDLSDSLLIMALSDKPNHLHSDRVLVDRQEGTHVANLSVPQSHARLEDSSDDEAESDSFLLLVEGNTVNPSRARGCLQDSCEHPSSMSGTEIDAPYSEGLDSFLAPPFKSPSVPQGHAGLEESSDDEAESDSFLLLVESDSANPARTMEARPPQFEHTSHVAVRDDVDTQVSEIPYSEDLDAFLDEFNESMELDASHKSVANNEVICDSEDLFSQPVISNIVTLADRENNKCPVVASMDAVKAMSGKPGSVRVSAAGVVDQVGSAADPHGDTSGEFHAPYSEDMFPEELEMINTIPADPPRAGQSDEDSCNNQISTHPSVTSTGSFESMQTCIYVGITHNYRDSVKFDREQDPKNSAMNQTSNKSLSGFASTINVGRYFRKSQTIQHGTNEGIPQFTAACEVMVTETELPCGPNNCPSIPNTFQNVPQSLPETSGNGSQELFEEDVCSEEMFDTEDEDHKMSDIRCDRYSDSENLFSEDMFSEPHEPDNICTQAKRRTVHFAPEGTLRATQTICDIDDQMRSTPAPSRRNIQIQPCLKRTPLTLSVPARSVNLPFSPVFKHDNMEESFGSDDLFSPSPQVPYTSYKAACGGSKTAVVMQSTPQQFRHQDPIRENKATVSSVGHDDIDSQEDLFADSDCIDTSGSDEVQHNSTKKMAVNGQAKIHGESVMSDSGELFSDTSWEMDICKKLF